MEFKKQYLKILKSNQRKVKDFHYTVPSSSEYPLQWLWDSCFHAIIYCSLKKYDLAKDEILSLLSMQWHNGMIPHMIYWTKTEQHKIDWGTHKKTSSITQPPMVAYAVDTIYNATGDKNYVKEVFSKLDKYYKWLQIDRAENYILSLIHPWESGQDDIVTWDNVYHIENPNKEMLRRYKINILHHYITMGLNTKKFKKSKVFNVKSLLFNSIYLKNLYSMIHLSQAINSKEVSYYKSLAEKVKTSQKKNFYFKKIDLYSSYYNAKSHFKNFENVNIFLPLFSDILTTAEARKLIKNYLLNEDKFWTKFPVPTVSIDDNSFQPNRYWRGSTWININWFIHKGLQDYGFYNIANTLKQRSVELIKKSGFCEYYNPLNGKGHGPNDYTWSGLIFDM